jgi:hypothetical protein
MEGAGPPKYLPENTVSQVVTAVTALRTFNFMSRVLSLK